MSSASKVQLNFCVACVCYVAMLLEMQVTLEKLTEPMHTKHCRDSEGPLTDSTIDFTCNLAMPEADFWGGVNAP